MKLENAKILAHGANIRWKDEKPKYERNYVIGSGGALPIVPMVAEAYGAIAEETMKFMHQVNKLKKAARGETISSSAKIKFMFSVGLKKSLLTHAC